VTDAAGRLTAFTYGPLGQQTAQTDALGDTKTWTYDKAGQLTKTVNARGQATSTTYDAAGQPASTATVEGAVTRTFDSAGRVTRLTDSNGTTAYSYDSAGRLASTTATRGGRTLTLGAFTTADTWTVGGTGTPGYNRNLYAGGDPVSNTDPTGHFVEDATLMRIAVINTAEIEAEVQLGQFVRWAFIGLTVALAVIIAAMVVVPLVAGQPGTTTQAPATTTTTCPSPEPAGAGSGATPPAPPNTCSDYPDPGQVQYGETELSQEVQQQRLTDKNRGNNYAAAPSWSPIQSGSRVDPLRPGRRPARGVRVRDSRVGADRADPRARRRQWPDSPTTGRGPRRVSGGGSSWGTEASRSTSSGPASWLSRRQLETLMEHRSERVPAPLEKGPVNPGVQNGCVGLAE
jgi:YD repeat-containing protein